MAEQRSFSRRAVTLEDVAREAQVHLSTVSRALDPTKAKLVNGETRLRIVHVAEELGYRPNVVARHLRKGDSGIIGVIVPDLTSIFTPQVLRGIEEVALTHNRACMITETLDDSDRLLAAVDRLVARRVDALIVTGAHLADRDILERVPAAIPTVLAIRTLLDGDFNGVVTDDRRGAEMAIEHLVELGHTNIVQLRGPQNISTFVQRSEGFHAVLERHGLSDDPASDPVEASIAEGKRVASAALERPAPPTAIFAHTDALAVGALDAIKAAGLDCPGDVSVVGYNDSPLSDHLQPPLTTVRIPSEEIGARASARAAELLADPDQPPQIVSLRPALIVRDSTGAPPARGSQGRGR